MRKILGCIVGLILPLCAIAEGSIVPEGGEIQIKNFYIKSTTFYIGMPTDIEFFIKPTQDIPHALVTVGVNWASPDLTFEENLANYDSVEPQRVVLSFQMDNISTYGAKVRPPAFAFPNNVDPDNYIFTINVQPVDIETTDSGDAIILADGTTTPNNLSWKFFPNVVQVVQLDKPNLRATEFSFGGNGGVVRSDTDEIRVNLEVSTDVQDIPYSVGSVSIDFGATINGVDFPLLVAIEDPAGNESTTYSESWEIEPSCVDCPVIPKQQSRSGALRLKITEPLRTALNQYFGYFHVYARVDSRNLVDEVSETDNKIWRIALDAD
ncbi:MAG: hypothetical protein OEZ43_14060 [Gammaproteobacteria bacterium]|nr:hypothetical protein [Gammaproteobacteria bacterium]